ncbi:MAG: imelysin family protein [Minwuia sp.]|uniref:imelysin family protein n=1 Tax=Minwuia sp. TaxID=2493630 RepID=UPI003A869475
MRWLILLAGLVSWPAMAQDFGAAVLKTIDEAVLPAYERLAGSADRQAAAVEGLCAEPDAAALDEARAGFAPLVAAYGGIEFVRFGPARDEFRHSRLYYWPDRRGRGLQQVQALLTGADPSALAAGALAQKSVALQGLGALEFALFGTDADADLIQPDSYRCRYAAAVARNMAAVAREIREGWQGDGGFRQVMAAPGPGNPRFRSPAETAQTLIDAAREQIGFVRDHKLAAVIGGAPDEARPRLAPLWRSGATLDLVEANIRSVIALFAESRLDRLVLAADPLLLEELQRELQNALDAVREAKALRNAGGDVFAGDEGHGLLLYATAPLGGVASILGERLPQALGLVSGFNALDGD